MSLADIRSRPRKRTALHQETPRSGTITFLTPRFRAGVPWGRERMGNSEIPLENEERWNGEGREEEREEREREKGREQRGWKMQSLSSMQLGGNTILARTSLLPLSRAHLLLLAFGDFYARRFFFSLFPTYICIHFPCSPPLQTTRVTHMYVIILATGSRRTL